MSENETDKKYIPFPIPLFPGNEGLDLKIEVMKAIWEQLSKLPPSEGAHLLSILLAHIYMVARAPDCTVEDWITALSKNVRSVLTREGIS